MSQDSSPHNQRIIFSKKNPSLGKRHPIENLSVLIYPELEKKNIQ